MSLANQSVGANGGPPIDPSDFDTGIDPAMARLAFKVLTAICSVLDRDPAVCAGKRKPLDALTVRQIWFYVLRPYFGRDDKHDRRLAELRCELEVLDEDCPAHIGKIERIKAEIAKLRTESLSKQKMLAKIAQLDRGTVSDDQHYIAQLCAQDEEVAAFIDAMADLADCHPPLLLDGEARLAKMVSLKETARTEAAEAKRRNGGRKLALDVSSKLEMSPTLIKALDAMPAALAAKVRAKWGVSDEIAANPARNVNRG